MTHHHHTGRAFSEEREGGAKHVDFLPLHLGAQSGCMPVNPVRISPDQHHSVNKQGKRHLPAGRHARMRDGRYPPERTAVRKWIADRHRKHIMMEGGDHMPH